MGEYFKPIRRKFGVLTLVMACVLMAGWVRSRLTKDYFDFRSMNDNIELLVSVDQSVCWVRCCPLPKGIIDVMNDVFNVFVLKELHRPSLYGSVKWHLKSYGLRIGTCHIGSNHADLPKGITLTIMACPHWWFITPLTLLSAYLLLSKPRKSTSKKTAEPIAVEGK